jgi:hypothetical protein
MTSCDANLAGVDQNTGHERARLYIRLLRYAALCACLGSVAQIS